MLTFNEITQYILPVINKHPIERVIVFGSYANGTTTSKSDIDLLIDSNGILIGMNFFIFADKLSRLLLIKTDVFELIEIMQPSPLYEKIMKEGVIIYERKRLPSF